MSDSHHAEMDSHNKDIDAHIRTYIAVFVALMAFTVVTVAISYLHLPLHQAIILALVIASIKVALVVLFFMHLISERKLIYGILALVVVFFVALLFLPVAQLLNHIHL